jgi:hypothetical protein
METREDKCFSGECLYVGRLLGDWQQDLHRFQFTKEHDSVDSRNISQAPETSARVRETRSLGYYNAHNCRFYQHFDEDLPEIFHRLAKACALSNYSVSLIRQDPGQVIPWHQDKFYTLKQRLGAGEHRIFRYVVLLEDWKTGHYLQIGNEPVVKWRAGDIFTYARDVYHLSGNCGVEPKYTMQVSGVEDPQRSLHCSQPREVHVAGV